MTEDVPEDVKAAATKAVFGADGRGMIGLGRRNLQSRVARAILAERERMAALPQDATAVLVNAMRGGINASSIRADERDRWVVLCNDYAESYEKALPLYGAADKDIGRGRQEGHIKAARDIAAAIRGDGNGEG